MEDENPFAAPQAELDSTDFAIEGDPTVVRVDKKLRMPEGAQLPTRCVKCNRPAQTQWEVATSNGLGSQSGAMAILFVMLGVFLLMVFVFYDISFLWLIPMVLISVAVVWWMQRHEPRPVRTTFYICPLHNHFRHGAILLLVLMVLLIFVDPKLGRWLGVELDETSDFPTTLLFVVSANLAMMLSPRIVGKKLENGLYEFQGFGKKYLQSFPTVEEPAKVSDEA